MTRHNRPRIGRILMARGRDATDTAITTAFGPAILRKLQVITEDVDHINCVDRIAMKTAA
jgi:hypothetical protein